MVALFLWPYVRVRQIGEVGVRDLHEIEQLSADTHAFATISENARLWGSRIRAMPRNEGQGFPGFAILAFAAAGIGIGLARAIAHARQAGTRQTWWRQGLAVLLGATLVVLLLLLGHALVTGRVGYSIAGVFFSHRPASLLVRIALVVLALLLCLASVSARRARPAGVHAGLLLVGRRRGRLDVARPHDARQRQEYRPGPV